VNFDTEEEQPIAPIRRRARWRHTWNDLFGEVLETGLCTGCSGCVIACPQKVLNLDHETWTPRLAPEASVGESSDHCRFSERGCTLCARACPRFGSWETDADLVMWSRVRTAEEVLGVHRRVLLVEATDPVVAEAGQDGALGTALLAYALDNGYIDSALVSNFDESQRTRPGVARTRAELLACAGSRYTYSPNLLAHADAIAGGAERIGVISVGCQTSVPPIARARGANKLAKRFSLVVGLLCTKTFSESIYKDLLEAEYGVVRERITKVNIKGRLQVWHTDTQDEPAYLEVPLSECRAFTRPGCTHCPDFAAEHADLSLGGIGKYAGRTLTITRSELGDEIINAMERAGLITVSDAVEDDPGAVALIRKLATVQRKRWPGESHPAPGLLPDGP
jgi:coenzyme F420 hydrogenase subunit beta